MGEFPKRTRADALRDSARVILNLTPIVGSALAALLDAVFEAPLSKRRAEYLRAVGEKVRELLEKYEVLTPEALSKNDMFVTAVAQGAQIALRAHQEEKIETLLNAIGSAAIVDIDEDIQQMFLRFIDELTPTHLRILKYLQDPPTWHQRFGGISLVQRDDPGRAGESIARAAGQRSDC